jgi:hypothetical protein
MIMQLALRPYATAGVVVVGAGLIYVTPAAAPHIEQRTGTVELAATETLGDLVGPFDAVASSLGGVGGSLWDSVTDALAPEGGALSSELGGVLPSLGDLSGTLADAADSTDFWGQVEAFFGSLVFLGALVFAGFLGGLQTIWEELLTALGIEPASALTAAATEVLDPSALTSALDLNPLADIGTAFDPAVLADIGPAFDPAVLADIGTVLSTSAIPDLGGILTSLIP